MGWNKKGEDEPFGWATLVTWAIIIAIGVVLFVIMVNSTGIGKTAFAKIKDFRAHFNVLP